MLWDNPNSALVSCSAQCKTPLQKLPSRRGGEQMYSFASAMEGSLPPELNAKVEARWMHFYFLHNPNYQAVQQQRTQVLLWLSFSAWDTNSLFYRIDQLALSKASLCFGSVWLSSIAKKRSSTSLATQTLISPRNILKQCTWRNALSIKNQPLKRNPYYLNMGARLVNLKAHMKSI